MMKKLLSLLTALAVLVSVTSGCAGTSGDAENSTDLTASLETIANEILALAPVEFQGQLEPVDFTDTSEEGQRTARSGIGLMDFSGLREAVVYEPVMSSMAFSMVLVRVADAADAQKTAQAMKDGIDPAKWICACADDIQTVGFGDVIFFIMLDSSCGLKAQTFVDAFREVCGADPDFQLPCFPLACG